MGRLYGIGNGVYGDRYLADVMEASIEHTECILERWEVRETRHGREREGKDESLLCMLVSSFDDGSAMVMVVY